MDFIKKILSAVKNLFTFNKKKPTEKDKSVDEPDNIYPMVISKPMKRLLKKLKSLLSRKFENLKWALSFLFILFILVPVSLFLMILHIFSTYGWAIYHLLFSYFY